MSKIRIITILTFILGATALYWGTILDVVIGTDWLGITLSYPGIFAMQIFEQFMTPDFGMLIIINGLFYAVITWLIIFIFILPLSGKREAGREIVS